MKRIGMVLVFNEDVSKEQAAAALAKIADVLDGAAWYPAAKSNPPSAKDILPRINEFNDDHGGPVWYCP